MRLIERPGYLGRKRDEMHERWNKEYGKSNWTFVWNFGERQLNFLEACRIYEDAYFMDSFAREPAWVWLFQNAKDVFDDAETNTTSSLDYQKQETNRTHLQDIAIRNVGRRRDWKFSGDRLIQVRGPESEGYIFTPGLVPFHLPKLIEQPNIAPKWAEPNSVESFYQNNRWLALVNGEF